jgi:Na+/H+ antiporter NhaA
VDGNCLIYDLATLLGAIGMAAPALIYLAFNWAQPQRTGKLLPMATDIAFTLGSWPACDHTISP